MSSNSDTLGKHHDMSVSLEIMVAPVRPIDRDCELVGRTECCKETTAEIQLGISEEPHKE
jgi:hypothetical protein